MAPSFVPLATPPSEPALPDIRIEIRHANPAIEIESPFRQQGIVRSGYETG